MNQINNRKLTFCALLVAISIVLVYLVKFPIFPIAPFLVYEPADIPILIGTYLLGTKYGLALTLITSLVQGLTVSADAGFIGILMHIFATGSFVCIAGFFAKKNNYVVATLLGMTTMTLSMIIWNLIFTPIFLGTPLEAVLSIMVPAIIPFNLIKGGLNGFIAIFLFQYMKKTNLVKF